MTVVRNLEQIKQFQDTCATAWVSIDEVSDRRHNVFPNPASGWLKFESPYIIASVRVWDPLGKELLSKPFFSKQGELRLPHTTPGVYYYQLIFSDDTRESGKFHLK
jgi:hypothetical protein